MKYAATLADVRAAATRLAGTANRTPVFTSRTLDALAGRRLFFKCEQFQRVGAFKFRGAYNAIARLDPATASRGVVTHSSGNHAQAVALAAKLRGIPAYIVMPEDAPTVKRAAVAEYGAEIHDCPPNLVARETSAAALVAATGATLIPPYDHPDVIAGQGTAGLELFEEVGPLDAVIVAVGGGGLLSGVTLALRELSPKTRVFAAEPEGADDAARSKAAGRYIPQTDPRTIADGLRTSLGEETTWPVVRDLVEDVITVDDAAIITAMRLVWERMKLVIEPSAAVPLAVALGPAFRRLQNIETVGVFFSGGNLDLGHLPF
jgi:threonine dehydratase/serine racemase